MVAAVAVGGVADHVAAVPLVEVHVDVGHLRAARIQEALEEEVVADRVEVDDLEAVGHATPRGRAAARPHPDTVRAGEANEVPDDEEVGGEAHGPDDAELVVEPLEHGGGDGVPVALLCPLDAEMTQVLGGSVLIGLACELVGHGELGQADPAEVDLHVGPLGDEQRVVARFGELGEEVAHLRRRLQVVLFTLEFEPLGVVDEGAGLDAQEGVMGHVVLSVGVMAVVGGQQGRTDTPGDLHQRRIGLVLGGDAVVLELDEEVVLAEDVLEPGRQVLRFDLVVGQEGLQDDAAEAAGGGDESFVVALEQLPVQTGLVVVPLQVGGRGELQQVSVPRRRLGQQGQVVVELLAAIDVAPRVVDLAPADRPVVA